MKIVKYCIESWNDSCDVTQYLAFTQNSWFMAPFSVMQFCVHTKKKLPFTVKFYCPACRKVMSYFFCMWIFLCRPNFRFRFDLFNFSFPFLSPLSMFILWSFTSIHLYNGVVQSEMFKIDKYSLEMSMCVSWVVWMVMFHEHEYIPTKRPRNETCRGNNYMYEL